MKDNEKHEYLKRYKKAKENGEYFFPDSLFKDAVVSLVIFVILVVLAYFVGAPLEARANPADTTYTPRPEWYFLFLFQLLKYFPGRFEVLGVVLLPTLAIIGLFLLPVIDRSKYRYPSSRPVILGITAALSLGVIFLTILAYREAPPPADTAQGDQIALLYVKNCAGCHGPSITVKPGTNLHTIITQGKHEGMPAWSADLSSDQIDALAGFILSPGGSSLFNQSCGNCHQVTELVSINPLELKNAIDQGTNYPKHQSAAVPDWNSVLTADNKTTLLNFLIAPDGQRLFAINCSPCHGQAISFNGNEDQLRNLISQGGMHLEMPPWREKISEAEIDLLARYVLDPASTPAGKDPYNRYCTSCHGGRIPKAESIDQASQIISEGGAHETMPVWGQVLTNEQIDALITYSVSSMKGESVELGQKLFAANCLACHGEFGEGGINPARPDDIIAPISTAEYLKTRDNFTLRAIISEGQPNLGMSPFATSLGGPLNDDEIDAIVAYMRSWESKPPVEIPPEVKSGQTAVSAKEIFTELCAQCHGLKGEGGIGPALSDPKFQDQNTDQQINDTINLGHKATAMIGWGEILTSEQIHQLVEYIRQLRSPQPTDSSVDTTESTSGVAITTRKLTFETDILPIFEAQCNLCHGTSGGWSGTNYVSSMITGDHKPVIIPGDVENSLLADKLLGTQAQGIIMPPSGKLPDKDIQTIIQWIEAGAQLTYQDTIGPLLQASCGSCHGGASPVLGMDLTTYATAMQGSANGSVILSGDPQNSLLVAKQSGEQPHYGQLNPDELQLVIDWITNDAPEK